MKLDLKIKSSSFELLESGSFITPNNERIEFELVNDEAPLSIAFEFSEDEENQEVRKKTSVKNSCLTIEFINYKDTRFTTAPWQIGKLYKRKLYILYHLEPLYKTTLRKISYSFYLGEEVKNG